MEQHCPCLHRLWIIEYAWAHNMMDVYQAMEASCWPEVDLESLSLDKPWCVRVASVQAFSIVRTRQPSLYERVLAFLEHTHTLLPTLVPAIKHMKIMFGLKTMVIMWMLKEGRGPVDVVYKIIQFFPTKLPQYQEHCSNREMFLMRKNQLDFKTFAEALAVDKKKLQGYIQNHMEEQYGEHYAQKTEDRLLHYLRELDKALPKNTYIDEILKKNTPMNEEEKLLLEIIRDDSIPIATTLKTLLHCDSAFCKSEQRARSGSCWPPKSPVCAGSSKDHLQCAASETAAELKTVGEVHSPAVAKDSHAVMDDGDGPTEEQAASLQTEGEIEGIVNGATTAGEEEADNIDMEKVSLRSSAHEVKLSPRFCSKHQRWVTNILRECSEEPSDKQQAQASESSPALFPSTSSSEDLTPSDLTLPPDQHQSQHNSSQSQEVPEGAKITKLNSELVDPGPLTNPAPSLEGAVLKVALVPFKYLTSITPCPSKPNATSQTDLICSNQDSQCSISKNSSIEHTLFLGATSPKKTFSKLSRKFRLSKKHFQHQKKSSQNHEAERPERVHVSPHTSSALLENTATHITSTSSTPSLPEKCSNTTTSANTHLETLSSLHSKTPSDSTGTWSTLDHPDGREGSRELRGSSEPHLSLHSQTFLLQSKLLQPCVVLKRISVEECLLVTNGRAHPRQCDDVEHKDTANSSFDVSSLYFSYSSESDSDHSDPDFMPTKKQLRRWASAYDI